MLTHPGTPCIFYDDLWTDGDRLRELIALRKRADVTCRSNVEILCADADMYVARIDNKCAGPACLGSKPYPRQPIKLHAFNRQQQVGQTISLSRRLG